MASAPNNDAERTIHLSGQPSGILPLFVVVGRTMAETFVGFDARNPCQFARWESWSLSPVALGLSSALHPHEIVADFIVAVIVAHRPPVVLRPPNCNKPPKPIVGFHPLLSAAGTGISR